MLTQLAPEGTDAAAYLILGRQCATGGGCWDPVRPIGALVYFSLPYRLGLPAEAIVVLNWALLALSTALAARLLATRIPGRIPARSVWATAIAAVSHIAFMASPAFHALSDVPSACLLLVGLELFALGLQADSGWRCGLGGLSLGLAAFLRAFYLYPVLLACLAVLAVGAVRRRAWRAVLLVGPALVPIALQVAATYVRTSRFAYLDPTAVQPWHSLHLDSSWSGYDTVLPGRPLPYGPPAREVPGGPSPSVRSGDLGGAVTLLVRRVRFYYGSWVPFGGVYLRSEGERIFSGWILAAHAVAAALALWWVAHGGLRDGVELPIAVLGAVFAEGLAIVPEARFVMALQAALWMGALAGVAGVIDRTAGRSSVHAGISPENGHRA